MGVPCPPPGHLASNPTSVSTTGVETTSSPSDFPVKNTFIHFEGASTDCKAARVLRKGNTDPSPPLLMRWAAALAEQPPRFLLPPDFGATPEPSPRDSSSSSAQSIRGASSSPAPPSTGSLLATSAPPPTPCESPEKPGPRRARPEKTQLVLSKQLIDSSSSLSERGPPGLTPFRTPVEVATPEPKAAGLQMAMCNEEAIESPPPPVSPPPVNVLQSIGDGIFFTFTIRRADGSSLGLKVENGLNGKGLVVHGIAPGGAIDAWNQQCLGSPLQKNMLSKVVQRGDHIASVNDMSDCAEMLEEVRSKHLLKLLVVRGTSQPSKIW